MKRLYLLLALLLSFACAAPAQTVYTGQTSTGWLTLPAGAFAPAWTASTTYNAGAFISDPAGNGHFYQQQTSPTCVSATTRPALSTTSSSATADSTCSWLEVGTTLPWLLFGSVGPTSYYNGHLIVAGTIDATQLMGDSVPDGATVDIRSKGANGDGHILPVPGSAYGTLSGVSTTSGSPAVVGPTGTWNSADANDFINIYEAGTPANGYAVSLTTTIASVTDSSHIVLATPAGATTANSTYVVWGHTDNTSAIHNAIMNSRCSKMNSSNTDNLGCRLYSPAGIYLTHAQYLPCGVVGSGCPTTQNNIEIAGAGKNSSIWVDWDSGDPALNNRSIISLNTNGLGMMHNITIHDMTIMGNTEPTAALRPNALIAAYGGGNAPAVDVDIYNIHATRAASSGIHNGDFDSFWKVHDNDVDFAGWPSASTTYNSALNPGGSFDHWERNHVSNFGEGMEIGADYSWVDGNVFDCSVPGPHGETAGWGINSGSSQFSTIYMHIEHNTVIKCFGEGIITGNTSGPSHDNQIEYNTLIDSSIGGSGGAEQSGNGSSWACFRSIGIVLAGVVCDSRIWPGSGTSTIKGNTIILNNYQANPAIAVDASTESWDISDNTITFPNLVCMGGTNNGQIAHSNLDCLGGGFASIGGAFSGLFTGAFSPEALVYHWTPNFAFPSDVISYIGNNSTQEGVMIPTIDNGHSYTTGGPLSTINGVINNPACGTGNVEPAWPTANAVGGISSSAIQAGTRTITLSSVTGTLVNGMPIIVQCRTGTGAACNPIYDTEIVTASAVSGTTFTATYALNHNLFATANALIFWSPGTVTENSFSNWAATTAYSLNTVILPTANDAGGFTFQVTTAGTSGGTAPGTWNQTVGGSQTDGTTTWKNIGLPCTWVDKGERPHITLGPMHINAPYSSVLNQMGANSGNLAGASQWQGIITIRGGDRSQLIVNGPITANFYWFLWTDLADPFDRGMNETVPPGALYSDLNRFTPSFATQLGSEVITPPTSGFWLQGTIVNFKSLSNTSSTGTGLRNTQTGWAAPAWLPSHSYGYGTSSYIVPFVDSNNTTTGSLLHFYYATNANGCTSGTGQPTFPTAAGATVTGGGGCVWKEGGPSAQFITMGTLSGQVSIAAGATSVSVSAPGVRWNSKINATFDSSLGSVLGITCNTTFVAPYVTARTSGTGFTLNVGSAPSVNPACFDYTVVN